MKEQDYCTFSPEGWWQHCCKAHDNAYELQTGKVEADVALLKCISDSGDGVFSAPSLIVALVFFTAVSIFGKRFYNR